MKTQNPKEKIQKLAVAALALGGVGLSDLRYA